MTYPSFSVTFLGTGTSSGVPMIGCTCAVCTSTDPMDKRLRSSILIKSSTTTVVIDTTPDFRYQMLRERVMHLDAVIFTHPHKDHIAGLDDIRAYNYFSKKPMEIFANQMTQKAIMSEFAYAFTEKKYPGIPKINLNTIDQETFTIGNLEIVPFYVNHLNMPVLAFRLGPFTYITDANSIEERAMQKIRGSQTLVLNALRKEKHISHFSLSEAQDIANGLGVERTLLTHMSHQLGKHADINNELPPHIQLAYDGLTINF